MSTDELYKEFGKLVPEPVVRFDKRHFLKVSLNMLSCLGKNAKFELVSLIEAEIFLSESFVPSITHHAKGPVKGGTEGNKAIHTLHKVTCFLYYLSWASMTGISFMLLGE